MADISKIQIESGTYNIKDETARIVTNKLSSEIYVDCIYRGENGGNCNLIRTEHNNILIDMGVWDKIPTLITYLKTNAIKKFNYIILTHYHSDHVGGNHAERFISFLQDTYFDFSDLTVILPHKNIDWASVVVSDVDYLMTAETNIKNYLLSNNIPFIEPIDNETLEIENDCYFKFNNIGSDYYQYYYPLNIYNNFSMLSTLVHNQNKFLFTGDIEEEGQKRNAKNIDSNVKVVTAPHHDLNQMSDATFLKKLSPEYALIMNLYEDGMPNWTGLGISTQFSGYLRSIETRIYSTNHSHNISILSKDDNLTVYSDYGTNTVNSNMITIGNGEEIPNGTDLNDMNHIGNYFTTSSENSTTLSNLPDNYTAPGPIRITNTQIFPLSRQLLQIMHTPNAVLCRQLQNGTDWTEWTDILYNGLGVPPSKVARNSDLNDYFKPGTYAIASSDDMGTLTNAPISNQPGTLEVRRLRYSNDHIYQTLYCDTHIYYRAGYSTGTPTTSETLTWDVWSTIL